MPNYSNLYILRQTTEYQPTFSHSYKSDLATFFFWHMLKKHNVYHHDYLC